MRRFEKIREAVSEANEKALLADGFEDALVGFVDGWFPAEGGGCSRNVVALYDREKCLRILMERDGMSYEGAEECF
jgi:hypothetical protein